MKKQEAQRPSKDEGVTMELPGGIIATNLSDEAARVLQARAAFVEKYCSERGWNILDLTLDQLLEIREQEEWKNPQ